MSAILLAGTGNYKGTLGNLLPGGKSGNWELGNYPLFIEGVVPCYLFPLRDMLCSHVIYYRG